MMNVDRYKTFLHLSPEVDKLLLQIEDKRVQVGLEVSKMSGQNNDDSSRSKAAADRTRRLILEQKKYLCKTMPRLVEKNGSCNIESRTIENTGRKYIQNIFMVLLDTQWRLIMPLFVVCVILSWLVFAAVYYTISTANGDFDDASRYGNLETLCGKFSGFYFHVVIFYGNANDYWIWVPLRKRRM
ncbi:hypothetical protein KUTeg_003248 [Tegillarca granosa]|uniref:Potassium channel inwardly rectifying transmembrane domain-containing protein n=1 Tax=Tegillarca granosa TaxID=220873 RepID=A0ABQ9FLK3_TEGGR|nr:hypothetical protein KUTeg_003248 [Tegillarca granosa]